MRFYDGSRAALAAGRHPYRDPPSPSPSDRRRRAAPDDAGATWVVLAVGLIPFVGLACFGRWSSSELGLAFLMATWAIWDLLDQYGVVRRGRP